MVILLHSVELLIVFHHASLKRKANLEYNLFWYILTNDKVCVSLIYIMWKTINMYPKHTQKQHETKSRQRLQHSEPISYLDALNYSR